MLHMDQNGMPGIGETECICPTCDLWGVVEAPSDRTGKGSVRVRVGNMQESGDCFDDVPVLTPYGGGAHGFWCLPEEGDVVRLSFPGGDFMHPVVTGCRYPADSDLVQAMCDGKKTHRAWKMPNGSFMDFSGEKGKGRIEIGDADHMLWELDQERQQIGFGDLDARNDIRVDGKDGKVTVTAQKEILFKCGKSSLKMQEDGTIVLSAEKLTLEAKSVQVQGKGKVQIKGQEIALEGSTGLQAKSGAQMKLESKGSLKLSGAMINLN